MTLKNQILIYILILSALLIGLIAIGSFLELDRGFSVLYNLWNIEPTPAKLAESLGRSNSEEEGASSGDFATETDTDSPSAFSLLKNQRITAYTIRPEEGTNCESASGVDICGWRISELVNGNTGEPTMTIPIYKGFGIIACPPEYEFEENIIEVNDVWLKCLDRMNAYHREMKHWDIFFGEGEEAVERANEWGERFLEIKVYK